MHSARPLPSFTLLSIGVTSEQKATRVEDNTLSKFEKMLPSDLMGKILAESVLQDINAEDVCKSLDDVLKISGTIRSARSMTIGEIVSTLELEALYRELYGVQKNTNVDPEDALRWWCQMMNRVWSKDPESLNLMLKGVIQGKRWTSMDDKGTHFIAVYPSKGHKEFTWRMLDHKPTVMVLLSKEPQLFAIVSNRLRKDRDVVMLAVGSKPTDRTFPGIAPLGADGGLFQYADRSFRDDTEIVTAAVNVNPTALQFASKRLQNNKALVLSAVATNGSALEWASDRLKGDPEVALEAMNVGEAFNHVSSELQNDKDFVLRAVRRTSDMYAYLSEEMRDDYDITFAALSKDGPMIDYAPEKFRSNRVLVEAAIRDFGPAFINASDDLKADPELILLAFANTEDDYYDEEMFAGIPWSVFVYQGSPNSKFLVDLFQAYYPMDVDDWNAGKDAWEKTVWSLYDAAQAAGSSGAAFGAQRLKAASETFVRALKLEQKNTTLTELLAAVYDKFQQSILAQNL